MSWTIGTSTHTSTKNWSTWWENGNDWSVQAIGHFSTTRKRWTMSPCTTVATQRHRYGGASIGPRQGSLRSVTKRPRALTKSAPCWKADSTREETATQRLITHSMH